MDPVIAWCWRTTTAGKTCFFGGVWNIRLNQIKWPTVGRSFNLQRWQFHLVQALVEVPVGRPSLSCVWEGRLEKRGGWAWSGALPQFWLQELFSSWSPGGPLNEPQLWVVRRVLERVSVQGCLVSIMLTRSPLCSPNPQFSCRLWKMDCRC